MSDRVFQPFDDGTVSLAVGVSSDRVAFTTPHNGAALRMLNSGDDIVFVKFGDASVVATTDDIPMLGNTVEVFAAPSGATHCAALSAGVANTLYITPGDGA